MCGSRLASAVREIDFYESPEGQALFHGRPHTATAKTPPPPIWLIIGLTLPGPPPSAAAFTNDDLQVTRTSLAAAPPSDRRALAPADRLFCALPLDSRRADVCWPQECYGKLKQFIDSSCGAAHSAAHAAGCRVGGW